jgi:hypothetical protein
MLDYTNQKNAQLIPTDSFVQNTELTLEAHISISVFAFSGIFSELLSGLMQEHIL